MSADLIPTRLEYLTPDGWQVVATYDLLHPEDFPVRLWRSRKVARAVTAERVYDSPAPAEVFLIYSPDGTPYPWRVSDPCTDCGADHPDGECLLD